MYHNPVLLQQCIEGLNLKPDGIYVDVTFGGGGHSSEILKQLKGGRLIGFDQDEDAGKNSIADERFLLIPQNFQLLQMELNKIGVQQVDGILADLGVSSHQFDSAERGFSTRFEGALDMRMNQKNELSASEIINSYNKEQLKHLFREYGEINNAGVVADRILKARELSPITTTAQLQSVTKSCAPRNSENKFFAQLFQALRIEVNNELDVLKELIQQSVNVLKPGGRLVMISYHSLEDRLVKNFIRSGKFEGEAEKDFYGNVKTPLIAVNRKVIVPDEGEIEINNRARSAKLRIAEKN